MEKLMGLLKVKVVRGVNLAKRDARGSDPYVVIRMGNQKVKTSVKKKDVNPEWNEELTLSVSDPTVPIKLAVYDKDTFSKDDRMGDADFNMWDIAEVVMMEPHQLLALAGEAIKTVKPTRTNCLAEESHIKFTNGKVCQDIVLRLRNVERGEIELQLQWLNIGGAMI
ncbi:hypothetical protein LUZ63_000795 [Rhynchospora breviuscula]|uniref:C2 domain-containing protein n=1 Tax=Rhynchospora breviuscula TaxID=2022672 RepID=A0A9Q0CVP3_9POAL|nr:hypothetical protein LUZ63_000795 [Rhynchospora breviuscula]